MAGNVDTTQSWLETVRLKFTEFIEGLGLSSARVIELLIAFGIGLVAGFIFNKIGRQVILGLVLLAVLVLGLQYLGIVTIDWSHLKQLIGIAPTQTLEGLMTDSFAWIKSHLLTVIVGGIGFLAGYKIS